MVLARVALNSPLSCLCLPCARNTGAQHHTWPLQCCCGSLNNHVLFPCSASVPLSLGSSPTLCPCVHKGAFYTTVRSRLDPGLPDPWVNQSIYHKMKSDPLQSCPGTSAGALENQHPPLGVQLNQRTQGHSCWELAGHTKGGNLPERKEMC